MEKTCFKCGETKVLEDFYKHPEMKDGHLNKCKECNKIDSSMRDPSIVREYDRMRAKNPARKAQFLIAQRRRRAENPEKSSAQQKCQRAVKSGKIVKVETCQVCHMAPSVLGHHEDYSKPLEVIWTCDPCHKRLHVKPIPF